MDEKRVALMLKANLTVVMMAGCWALMKVMMKWTAPRKVGLMVYCLVSMKAVMKLMVLKMVEMKVGCLELMKVVTKWTGRMKAGLRVVSRA